MKKKLCMLGGTTRPSVGLSIRIPHTTRAVSLSERENLKSFNAACTISLIPSDSSTTSLTILVSKSMSLPVNRCLTVVRSKKGLMRMARLRASTNIGRGLPPQSFEFGMYLLNSYRM